MEKNSIDATIFPSHVFYLLIHPPLHFTTLSTVSTMLPIVNLSLNRLFTQDDMVKAIYRIPKGLLFKKISNLLHDAQSFQRSSNWSSNYLFYLFYPLLFSNLLLNFIAN